MTRLILASESRSRQKILTNAGVAFQAKPAHVDEEMVKDSMLAQSGKPQDVADILAELKAVSISQRYSDAYVLGADQVLVLEGALVSKAKNIVDAKTQLAKMSGKTHSLISAAVIAQNGRPIWRASETAKLTMRVLDKKAIDAYFSVVGETVLSSVGCYHLEGAGAQLFDEVKGDFFTILGLPLFKVLAQLRLYGIIAK